MSQQFNFYAPPGVAETLVCRSGNQYTIGSNRTISGVVPADILDMQQAGCICLGSPSGLPWVTGRFYGLPKGATLEALLTVTNTLYAYPLNIPNNVTLSSLNVSVTTGQTGGKCHIGIYADAGGYPGALVLDSGEITGLTATAINSATGLSTNLGPGQFWMASTFAATSTLPSVAAIKSLYTGVVSADLGADTAAHALATASEAGTGISVTSTYGALPTTFPTGATLTLNADTPVVSLGV